MHNFYETPNSSIYGKTEHPTEKPIDLIKWLIKIGSKEDDITLDPFLGSGTTAVACIETGRNFIGIEINKEYCSIANKRIRLACEKKKQIKLNYSSNLTTSCRKCNRQKKDKTIEEYKIWKNKQWQDPQN